MQNDKFIAKEMNQLQWTCGFQPKVLLAIADGSEEMEVVMINAVLQRAKVRVVVASVAEMLLSDAAKLSYDLIVLPGGLGGAQAFAKSDALVNLLRKQSERGRYYGAISTSSNLVHRLLKVFISCDTMEQYLHPLILCTDYSRGGRRLHFEQLKTKWWLMANLSPAEEVWGDR